ncbi:MAG: hypothetical protein JJT99_12095 [Rhodobacteraceae bacterium]|nr:hypothetical protein [Paracoccaceae bacterium]
MHHLLFCALVSKEIRKPQNSEADTLIIAPPESSTRRLICVRPIHRKQTKPPTYLFKNQSCQTATETKKHEVSAKLKAQPHATMPPIYQATSRPARPPPQPAAFPPPVKRYLGNQTFHRKRKKPDFGKNLSPARHNRLFGKNAAHAGSPGCVKFPARSMPPAGLT